MGRNHHNRPGGPPQPAAAQNVAQPDMESNMPVFAVTGALIEEEADEVRKQGCDPADYIALRATALAMQPVPMVNDVADKFNRHPRTHVLTVMVQCMVPIDPKIFSSIAGADGQPLMRTDKKLLGSPPLVRLVLRRDMLTESVQQFIATAEAEQARAALLAGFSGAGPLGAALDKKSNDPEG